MFLYCISDSVNRCKFGYSIDPHARLRSLQTGNSGALSLVHIVSVDPLRIREYERILHREIGSHRRLKGEWFSIDSVMAKDLLLWFEIHYL
jgi:hypothetical protein